MRTATLTEAQSNLSAYVLPNFVIRQGEPNPSGNIYTNWATAHAAALLVPGPKIIEFDSSLNSCSIGPSGIYDITDITLQNLRSPTSTTDVVTIDDGVKLSGMWSIGNFTTLESHSSSSVFDVVDKTIIIFNVGAQLRADGASAPPLFIDNGIICNMLLNFGSSIGDSGTPVPAVQVDGTGQLGIYVTAVGSINSNSITGTGIVQVAIASTSAQIDPNQPGLTTPMGVFNLCSASLSNYIYVIGDLPLWNTSPQITDVQVALTSLNHRADFFIFQPNGANGGPFYTSWITMYDAIVALQGPRKITVIVDDTFGPVVIPAGFWGSNSCEIEFVGMGASAATGTPTQMILDDGVVLTLTDITFTDLGVTCNNTTGPVIDVTPPKRVRLRGLTTLTTAGTSPFMQSFFASPLRLEMHDYSKLIAGTSPIVSVPNGGVFSLHADGEAIVEANTLSIGSGTIEGVQSGGAVINPTQPLGTFPVRTAGTFVLQFNNSDLIANHLTGDHELGVQWVSMTVYDDNNDKIIPDNENVAVPTNYDIDLTSFVPITGTWTLVVTR